MSNKTATLIVFIQTNLLVYLLAGPAFAAGTGAVMLLAMLFGAVEYKRGRIEQEAIDDEKRSKAVTLQHARDEAIAEAATGHKVKVVKV